MNMNSKEWFQSAMAESQSYTRATAWVEAEVVSSIADIQGCLKFGIITASEALARLTALRADRPDIVAIIENDSPWLSNFEASLIEQVYGSEPKGVATAADDSAAA